ncbi:DNA circularization protein [Stenotrophomonas maltophilia]|uniref:DNA circularization protein n=1 Tax=Stenotrophomonas maltophilia TaxID=40324 RepID=UPI0013DBD815|nr:DNA circularization N-terminal domain-containing protein [Stenotrophomonas maltophilia]
MSWKDQLRKASFRGVEFHVLNDMATFGRRTLPHEYPFRDVPYVEDIGRAARRLRIDAIILGEDYMSVRDALIVAIETEGPGKLIHPQYGEMLVSLVDDGATLDHSSAEGGCCRIAFSCIESGEITFPVASTATATVVQDQAEATHGALEDGFASIFSLSGLQSFGIQDAVDRAGNWLGELDGAVAAAAAGATGPLSNLVSAIASARSSINGLLNAPANFASTVTGLVGAVATAFGSRSAVHLLTGLSDFGSEEATTEPSTSTRRTMAANRTAFLELVHGAVATESASALTGVEFTDYNDAIALRDEVLEAIDRVADASQNDTTYQALRTLRAAVVRDVATRGADLARIITVTPPATAPALVLAYQIYGDAARDLSLVSRNQSSITRPGFVPGGRPLEVAIDA